MFVLLAALLAQDDIEYARGLARRGCFDLAEAVLEKIPRDPAVGFVRAEMLAHRGELDEAILGFEKFRTDHPAHALATDALFAVGWLRLRQARVAAEEGRPEEAAKLYSELEKFHEANIARGFSDEAALMEARLELPRVFLEHSRFPAADRDLLRKAIRLLEDFEYDYCDCPVSFEACDLRAQCYAELGDFKEAERGFRVAIYLREKMIADGRKLNEYHWKVVKGAYLHLAQMQVRAGRPKEAVATIDRALRLEDPMFNDALQAERRKALGVFDPPWPRRPAPHEWLAASEKFAAREDWIGALGALRKCIEGCGAAELGTILPEARYRMGLCFKELNRPYEAVVAFERVYLDHPRDELAPVACFEAIRCLAREWARSGDTRDRDRRDAAIEWLVRNGSPLAGRLILVQAEEEESAGHLDRAIKLLGEVSEKSDAYEYALAELGRCLIRVERWDRAEETLRRLVEKNPKDPALRFVARQLLARVLVRKPGECLPLLADWEKSLDPADERRAKIWAVRITCLLALGRLDDAAAVLEEMLARFPSNAAVPSSCKAVARELDAATIALIDGKGDEKRVRENLRKLSRYLGRWLDSGMSLTLDDVRLVAAKLYFAAWRLNERQAFLDAAFAYALLLERGPAKDKFETATRLGRCCAAAGDWEKAKEVFVGVVSSEGLLDGNDRIDVEAVRRRPETLLVYLELGDAYVQLGLAGQKFQFDNALTVYSNVLRVSADGSKPWWEAKLRFLAALFDRGGESDFRVLRIALDNLEKNRPDFDRGEFGMKPKFLELKEKVAKVAGK